MGKLSTPRRKTKKNPKVGKHADLFGGDTDVLDEWMSMSPSALRDAVEAGRFSEAEMEEMLGEMADWYDQAQADGDVDALVAEGMSRDLAKAVSGLYGEDLHDELTELDETGREKRIAPLVDYLRQRMLGNIEYATTEGQDGFNDTYDRFLQDLEADHRGRSSISDEDLLKAAREVSDLADETSDEALLAVIREDQNVFEMKKHESYYSLKGQVWSEVVGTIEDQLDGMKYDEYLDVLVNGGKDPYPPRDGRPEYLHRLSDSDIEAVQKELENNDPYISVGYRGTKLTREDFERSLYMTVDMHDTFLVVVINGARLDELLEGIEPEPVVDPDTIYRYTGSNAFTSGASSKGMYVVELKAFPGEKYGHVKHLVDESAALGHCIGAAQHKHPQALQDGKTRVFSIRTESGRPKFTIELSKDSGYVREIKGKSNRLPGFPGAEWRCPECSKKRPAPVAGAAVRPCANCGSKDPARLVESGEMTQPDEVRAVIEFLQALYGEGGQFEQPWTDEDQRREIADIRDLKGAILAMQQSGIDPFVPPVVKRREVKKNPATRKKVAVKEHVVVGPYAAQLVEEAFDEPMGTYRG